MNTRTKVIVFGIAAAAIIYLLRHKHIYISTLVDPQSVKFLSDQLPDDEENFIFESWRWVSDNIHYESFQSDVFFNSYVECEECYSPSQVLVSGSSNCLGKSALLVSILRNKIPADRVRIVIGELKGVGGHAWVEYQRISGEWYVLESTYFPSKLSWLPVKDLTGYVPMVYINDKEMKYVVLARA